MGSIKDSLTFDDVSLIPQESSVVPNETITKITLHKSLNLQIPLISSAMDTCLLYTSPSPRDRG